MVSFIRPPVSANKCLISSWLVVDSGSQQFPTVQRSFEYVTRRFAGPTLVGVSVLAILPLPTSFMLGLSGEPMFFLLAPISLLLAMATVGCTCFVLSGLQWVLGKLSQILTTFGCVQTLPFY